MKTSSCLFALATLFIIASPARAQSTVSSDTSAVPPIVSDTAPSHVAVRSSMDAPPAAIRRNVSDKQGVGYSFAETHKGLGRAQALMGVGIVGFVAGALIGDDSGRIIMVGSAVVGLYGLYLYLQ